MGIMILSPDGERGEIYLSDKLNCSHDGCGSCCGGSCAGCGASLELTEPELELLDRFAQIPFLPVARAADSEIPVYLEESEKDYGPVIATLERKQLIDVDYWRPLSNFDYAAYGKYSCKGSMALTARGQQVLEILEIQGIRE